MEVTIRIDADSLELNILEGIKAMFPHKDVKITIEEDGPTAKFETSKEKQHGTES
jgi:hypothetical protein